jgi:hypothetical protein
MQRPLLPSLARAKSLAKSAGRFVAVGEARALFGGHGRVRLRVPITSEFEGAANSAMRFALIGPDGSIRATRLRVLSVECRADMLIINAETREAAIDGPVQLFLVTFESSAVGSSVIEALDDSAVDARSNALAGLNYLVRDYNEFLGLLLNRISTFDPSWTDRNPADLGVMLAEVLAYLADDLAYYQDAVATEAYLATARRRVSVRRHARLLDYWLDPGCGSRVWVRFSAAQQVQIPAGTALLTAIGGPPIVQAGSFEDVQLRKRSNLVFETAEDVVVYPGLTRIPIIDRGGRLGFSIAAGATEVEVEDVLLDKQPELPNLVEEQGRDEGSRRLSSLEPGYVLMFETRSDLEIPVHAVRIIAREPVRAGLGPSSTVLLRWDPCDAPARPLPISKVIDGTLQRELTVATGNVSLADFGETQRWQLPAFVNPSAPYRPSLPVSVVPLAAHDWQRTTPAAVVIHPPQNMVRAAITLFEQRDARALAGEATIESAQRRDDDTSVVASDGAIWRPVPDLLLSEAFSRVFVAESESLNVELRFGDGVFGRAPPLGASFLAMPRVGDPGHSNIGSGAIATIVAPYPAAGEQPIFEAWAPARLTVDNPLPAVGGRGPERLATAKRGAPALANQINAALTLADCRELAARVSGVADVAAVQRWTGSWVTTFVYVRTTDLQHEPNVLANVERVLELGRVAGREFIVRPPEWVALALSLGVTLRDGFGREGVRAALRRAFFRVPNDRWGPGFFHPSRWRFGEAVWASAISTWAKGVAGVAAVKLLELVRVRDRGAEPRPVPNKLTMAPAELPQVSDDPGQPQLGYLRLEFDDEQDLDSPEPERAW